MLYLKNFYKSTTLLGIISKVYNIQGTIIINEITMGNNTVQQNNISWSKRILGKEALIHINVNIIIELFKPKAKVYNVPCIIGLHNKSSKVLFNFSLIHISKLIY